MNKEKNTLEQPDRRHLLKDSLAALERMEEKLRRSERSKTEPVAIVGMSCRLPGGANTPADYWRILENGVDAVTDVPSGRWDVDHYYSPGAPIPGKTYTRRGAFLNVPVDRFDPSFFGISPREAGHIDPQQRLLLELTWEALEDAGIPPASLAGSAAAIYLGISTSDYLYLQYREMGERCMDSHFGTGMAHSIASGRLAYLLDVHGPNFPIDTACSSSMVAVHSACQSLRIGECSTAIAAGVSLILSPHGQIIASNARMLSPDGRCKSFDDRADGYVRGEGAGVVVLKLLSDALAAGDRIHAVIRGTAVNQDGRSSGVTAPNGRAQEAVIRAALANGGVRPEEVTYVEAHGTGTSLGDPIEVEALGAALCDGRKPEDALTIGSSKTNIGHLEAAAGVAGLIKAVLALEHRQIPRHLHFERPSSHIRWELIAVRVPVALEDWKPGRSGRRIAGVSSFGFSGTNAHLVIEEAPAGNARDGVMERGCHLLPISARTEAALKEQCGRFAGWLEQHPGDDAGDVCYTAGAGRTHFTHRLAVVGRDSAELAKRLRAWAGEGQSNGVRSGRAPRSDRRKVAFLFSGQGSQYVGMGAELYRSAPVFRAAIDRCEEILGGGLKKLLWHSTEGELEQTENTQPALFALEYGLWELWRSWGVTPWAVGGHSIGEYVAATVAGVFELEAGLRLVAERGRLMQRSEPGRMAAVLADKAVVEPVVRRHGSGIWIAAVNGPGSVVLSGKPEAVEAVLEEFTRAGVASRTLRVSHAFHSGLMDPILDELERAVERAAPRAPKLPIVSNLSGRMGGAEMGEPGYWRRHTREAVQYSAGVEELLRKGCEIFVEVGPGSTLTGLGQSMGSGDWVSTLGRGRGEWEKMLEAASALYTQGTELAWREFDRPYDRRILTLPSYAFQRERYWITPAHADTLASGQATVYPLCRDRLRSPALDKIVFESSVDADSPDFITHHRFFGKIVLPASGFLEAILEAGRQILPGRVLSISDFQIPEALILPETGGVRLQTICSESPAGYAISVCSSLRSEPDTWKVHARAVVTAATGVPQADDRLLAPPAPEELSGVPVAAFYQTLATLGVEYGEPFRRIEEMKRRDGYAVGWIQTPPIIPDHPYIVDPTLLDACLQVTGAALPGFSLTGHGALYMPEQVGALTSLAPPQGRLMVQVRLLHHGQEVEKTIRADIDVLNEDGQPAIQLRGVRFRRLQDGVLRRWWRDRLAEDLYQSTWVPQALNSTPPAVSGSCLMLADTGGVGDRMAELMRRQGLECILVRRGERRSDGQSVFHIQPTGRQDFHWLIEHLGSLSAPLRYAVNLWPLDAGEVDDPASLDQSQELVCASTLYLVQALASARLPANLRLCLVSKNAFATGPAPIAFAQASLNGLARVIGAEHPELQVVHVDIDDYDGVPALVCRELVTPGRENVVVYRGGERLVERLDRCSVASTSDKEFRAKENCSYLITGGFGALGTIAARTLIGRGAQYLVFMSRREVGAREQSVITELEGLGAKVLAVKADVAERSDVDRALLRIGQLFPPVRGIIHTAGILEDGLLLQQEWPSFQRVLAAKARGAWNLHSATSRTELDFFVLYSSIAALFGSPGQGNYAAANALLDGFAHHRASLGLPALSINWGAWAHAGMAAELNEALRRRISGRGIEEIEPADGAELLAMLMGQTGLVQCTAAPIHWPKLLSQVPAGFELPLFSTMAAKSRPLAESSGYAAEDQADSASQGMPSGIDLGAWYALGPAERTTTLRDWVRTQVGAVLGLAPETLDDSAEFATLGLDSLLALEVRNRVQLLATKPLSPTTAFDYPSVETLSDFLSELLQQAQSGQTSNAVEHVWI